MHPVNHEIVMGGRGYMFSHQICTDLKNGPDELQNHWKAEKAERGRPLKIRNTHFLSAELVADVAIDMSVGKQWLCWLPSEGMIVFA